MVSLFIFGILAVIISAKVECVPTPISPCDPSPCGPNAACGITENSRAVCACLPGYGSSPPNCHQSESVDHNIYESKTCDTKKCEQNAECYIGEYGHASCRCKPGYMITSPVIGLCFQCGNKFDFHTNQTCSNDSECVDPCPGVCGPNDECYVFNHKAGCRPKGSQPTCSSHADCPSHEACDGYKCVDPCQDLCYSDSADCKVTNHEPNCTCETGFYGSPKYNCFRNGSVE